MAKSLVIIESATKAKTLSKYLGRNYQVLASVGHLKDLPKRKLGIDLEHNFDGSVAKNRFVRYATGFHVGPS
jgi:DNA topoisomerase-1